MKNKTQQYSEYVANGGNMTLEQWEQDGRYDRFLADDITPEESREFMESFRGFHDYDLPLGNPPDDKELMRKGVELFGNIEEFKKWLSIPNIALGNVAPEELLFSESGVKSVEEVIEALNYGNIM